MQILFPGVAGKLKPHMLVRYYNVYYTYVLNTLKYVGADIALGPDSAIDDGMFTLTIDGVNIVIDYSDHLHLARNAADYPFYFKFHYSEGHHEGISNVYPFTPTSFYDWKQYSQLENNIVYTGSSNKIINRQIPYSFAIERRRKIQALLKNSYGDDACIAQIAQAEFWKEAEDCLAAVFVPGFRNNMLDRGQLQYMALGACTISPYHINILPGFYKIVSGNHYIECKADYSDLREKIEWCRNNREQCIEIGRNAKQLFLTTSTPENLWNWVKSVIHG